MNNILKIIACTVLMLCVNKVDARSTHSNQKKVVKSFAADENTVLLVENKYGRVSVETWEKDSIRFDIIIKATDRTEEAVTEMLEEAQVDFSSSLSYIKAQTQFKDEGVSIITGINRLTESLTKGEVQLNVHYRIQAPSHVEVEIENKYGDVHIGDRAGKTKVYCSHGDVRVSDLEGYLSLELKFGDFNAQTLKRLDLICEYSDVVAYKIYNAFITSKSSKINVQHVDRLRAETKRDDYTIYKLNDISCEGVYSDFVITQLSGGINLSGKYCHLTVHEVVSGFNRIMVNADKSHANFSLATDCYFVFDINIEEGDFTYPDSKIKNTVKEIKGEQLRVFGHYGSKDARSSIEVIGDESNVNFSIH